MEVKIVGKNIEVTNAIKEKTTEKLNKLNKYFKFEEDTIAKVLVRTYPYGQKIEVTIPTKNAILRAEVKNDDLYSAIDLVVDKLTDQIRRQKTKLSKKGRNSLVDLFVDNEYDNIENADEVVRTKQIELENIDLDEAIMKMEMLNHQFYIYQDIETNNVSLVYKRNDGGYGCIETI